MFLKRIFVTLLICASISANAFGLEVSAKSAALYDPASGRFLYEKNAEQRLPMASTTKVMTALIVLENLDLREAVEIKREYTLTEGSSMYLKVGEQVTVDELLYGLLLMSGNDAAAALAGYMGGNEAFAARMNARAATLGLTDTHFTNPHGLNDDEHYSTAHDMAVLSAECMKNETFRKIVSTKSAVVAGRHMSNHNKLLAILPGADGIKTGYTTRAGRCLLSSLSGSGGRLIAVTLAAPDDWRDHAAMYGYADDCYPERSLLEENGVLYYMPVMSGEVCMVPVTSAQSLNMRLSGEEYARVEVALALPKFVYAPVENGQAAGKAICTLDGQTLAEIELLYADSSALSVPPEKNLWEMIQDFFAGLAKNIGI